jgi:hypothetical protein
MEPLSHGWFPLAGGLPFVQPQQILGKVQSRKKWQYKPYVPIMYCREWAWRLGHEGMSREGLKSKVRQELKTTKRRKKPKLRQASLNLHE